MKLFAKKLLILMSALCLILPVICVPAFATDETTKMHIGEMSKVKTDKGYSGKKEIDIDDPQYGWELGDFVVSGFSRKMEDKDGNPVFLKSVGDKLILSFDLNENIDKLNGNGKLVIASMEKSFDEYFETPKDGKFGRGALIVKYTDYQNNSKVTGPYTDYLVGKKVGADTQIQLCEEGDYEIALDYTIKTIHKAFDKVGLPSSEDHYRIFAKFSVRNGNCMVYPFDVETKSELNNSSITPNGFSLDLAKSRYLNIDVKKSILREDENGLIDDARFNTAVKDGAKFTDEGVYTITVSNNYTGAKTIKEIYVGTNDILKAHVTTGLDIQDIKDKVALGAVIQEDGTIKTNTEVIEQKEVEVVEVEEETTTSVTPKQIEVKEVVKTKKFDVKSFVLGIVLGTFVGAFAIYYYLNNPAKKGEKCDE